MFHPRSQGGKLAKKMRNRPVPRFHRPHMMLIQCFEPWFTHESYWVNFDEKYILYKYLNFSEYDPLRLNEWNTFSLIQRFDASSGNFLFKVTINEKVYPTMQNSNPLEYPKMRVYNARHYTPVFGDMRHLIIKSW